MKNCTELWNILSDFPLSNIIIFSFCQQPMILLAFCYLLTSQNIVSWSFVQIERDKIFVPIKVQFMKKFVVF